MEIREANTPTTKICGICAIGRQHKEAETKAQEKASELLMVVHTDLCGPMQTASLDGEQYLITFTNEMSGHVRVCLLHSKDRALAAFQTYQARAEKTSERKVKSIRSDGGGEYLNKRFLKYLVESGIQHKVTPP